MKCAFTYGVLISLLVMSTLPRTAVAEGPKTEYFCQLVVAGDVFTRRMVLLK